MTPKEQAKELYNRMWLEGVSSRYEDLSKRSAKQCALICVDRSIELLKKRQEEHSDNFWCIENAIADELEVKQEINKL